MRPVSIVFTLNHLKWISPRPPVSSSLHQKQRLEYKGNERLTVRNFKITIVFPLNHLRVDFSTLSFFFLHFSGS